MMKVLIAKDFINSAQVSSLSLMHKLLYIKIVRGILISPVIQKEIKEKHLTFGLSQFHIKNTDFKSGTQILSFSINTF